MKNKIITFDDESYNILLNLIRRREKHRFQQINIFQNCIRLLILMKSLHLPGYTFNLYIYMYINTYRERHLDPIFVCFCGLIDQIISLFNAAMQKQKLIKLEERDKKKNFKFGIKMSRSVSNATMESIEENN